MRVLALGGAALALLLFASPARAQVDLQRRTLEGLKGVAVAVQRIPPEVERDGLLRSTLQTDVEQRLRQAGIPVLTGQGLESSPGAPRLYVEILTYKTTLGVYAFSVMVSLVQTVSLTRAPGVTTVAATWRSNALVGTVRTTDVVKLREGVRDHVDQFIDAYLTTNARR